jgi:hypothetical protein
MVDWINATAPRPQPLFAVSTALALGSVACGRRYRGMPRGNFTSLYFFHLGVSGSGKDYAKEAIYRALEAGDWSELIGRGSSYASDSAVFSALYAQPQHVTITDEIGRALANAKSEGGMHLRSAISALIEVWGSLHGRLYPKHYSTAGLTKDQADAMSKRVVHKPALTMVAMAQPSIFWASMDEGAIRDGFLARLIMVETDIGRGLDNECPELPIPDSVARWLQSIRASRMGNLGQLIDAPADLDPSPIDVPSDKGAQAAFRAYQAELIAHMDELEKDGLSDLLNRRAEQAMRVATIVAVSVNVLEPVITKPIAEWAIAFVRFHCGNTLNSLRLHMHGSPFAKLRADVLASIKAAGPRGRTEAELARYSRAFSGLEPRMRRSVLDSLTADSLAALADMGKGPSGRGKTRKAWVALDTETAEEDDGLA